jgi:hypothetical protein
VSAGIETALADQSLLVHAPKTGLDDDVHLPGTARFL